MVISDLRHTECFISQKQDGYNMCNHENNMQPRLSPQWLYGNFNTYLLPLF